MQSLAKFIKPKIPLFFSLRHLSTLPPQPATTTATVTRSDTDLYDELIYEAGQSRNFQRLTFLLTRRITEGRLNTYDTFRFITKSQNSVAMLDELFENIATLPKGATRKNAFDVLICRLCKLDLIHNALHMLDEMLNRNLEVNAFSFRPVIETFIENNELEKAVELLYAMKGFGVGLDAASYDFVLREYCKKGDVGNAVEWLEKMVCEEGLKGDSWTYNAMVICACKVGKVEGALSIVRAALDDKGVKINHYMYEYVIRSLLEDEFYEFAVKFVMICAGRFEKLDKKLFDFLAVGLMMCKRFEDAKMVVDEMSKRGLGMSKKVREFHDEISVKK